MTAPLFGHASAEAYYADASTGSRLGDIAVPTLLITAEDAPLAPAGHLPQGAHRSQALHVLRTRFGGHVGFVAGSLLRPHFFAEQAVVEFLAAAS